MTLAVHQRSAGAGADRRHRRGEPRTRQRRSASRSGPFGLAGLSGLGLALLPGLAQAHSPIKGLNHFYNGLLHPVLVAAHLLLLLGLGLFLAQQRREASGAEVASTLGGAVAGVAVAALLAQAWPWTEVAALVAALGIGVLVAARPSLASALRCALAFAACALAGLDSVPEGLSGLPRALSLAGTAVGLCLLPALSLYLAEWCSARSWQIIGQRILGSWIAAASALVLALTLKSAAG